MNTPTSSTDSISRRHWLGATLTGACAFLGGAAKTTLAAEVPKPQAALKFSSWYNQIPGSLPDRLAFLAESGVEGIELRGVGQLPGGVNGNPLSNTKYFKEVIADTHLKATALDWGNFSAMVSDSPAERHKSIDSLKRAIDVAAEFGAPNIIAVPPRLGRGVELPDAATSRKILLETLPALGEIASRAGTCILIEPCVRIAVNCFHVVADVAAFVRESKCPGLGIVADFSLMMVEETNITGAMLSGGAYVRQVHLSSLNRKMPGVGKADELRYREGFQGLKMIGYQGYCSFECGDLETFPGGVSRSMEFLRRVWSQV